MLVFVTLAVLAGLVGRLTFVEETQVVLISPVSGVAFLWLANGPRRSWWWDVPALSAASALTTYLADGTLDQALVGVLNSPVQPVVVVLLLRHWAPHLWGGGGDRSVGSLSDLMRLLAACAVGALVSAAVRGTGLGLLPALDGAGVAMTWVRNFCWTAAVAVIALLLPPGWRTLRALGRLARTRPRDVVAFLERPWEVLAILAVGAALYVAALWVPLPFAIILVTVWAALRLPPVVATTQGVLSGISALVLALEDIELLAHDPGPLEAAALAQGFTVVMLVTAATVSLMTQARRQALERAGVAELEADRRATLLDTVVARLHEGVVVVSADGQELLRNPAGRTIPGLAPGTSYDEAMPGPEFGLFDERGRRQEAPELPHALALRGQDSPAKDFLVRTPDNPEGLVLEITATALPPSHADEVPRAVVIFRDVTAARRERDVLAGFAGVVAHDLNNPLTVASGWLGALRMRFEEGPLTSEEALPVLARVERATSNMRDFIGDLLAYAVAENQQLQLTDLDLSAVVEDVASLRRQGDHPARIDVQHGLRVNADPVLVRQLMDNLVGNAVKYVGEGVTPHVRVQGADPDADGRTLVRVLDNGIGVPDAMRRRIFESFERAHAQDYTGTGLGLAICRQIVERHGGTISVAAGEGGGSEFSFTLPAPVG